MLVKLVQLDAKGSLEEWLGDHVHGGRDTGRGLVMEYKG